MSLQWWQGPCQPLDHVARIKAETRQQQLTKPAGALGRLEALAIHLAALQGRERPTLEHVWIAIFAGDHGVVAEGISAYPQAVTGQMLLYKLEPGHIHLQVLGLMRISRTVQWWREAAGRQSLHLHRIAEETLLTAAYLRSFIHWLRHPDEDAATFRAYLRRQLRGGPLPLLLQRP